MLLKGHILCIKGTLRTVKFLKELQKVTFLFLLFVKPPGIGDNRDNEGNDNDQKYTEKRVIVCRQDLFQQ
jgi:hypothetical protein